MKLKDSVVIYLEMVYMKKLEKRKELIFYISIWLLCILVFWITPDDCGMLYSILVFYIILPIVTFFMSYYGGRMYGKFKWILPFFFGFMEAMASWFTFDLANMITFKHLNVPDWEMAVGIMMISVVGLIIGCAKNKKRM